MTLYYLRLVQAFASGEWIRVHHILSLQSDSKEQRELLLSTFDEKGCSILDPFYCKDKKLARKLLSVLLPAELPTSIAEKWTALGYLNICELNTDFCDPASL